jgi:nitrate/TMAO reductase-like tetraheme cytochrome c subunit
MLGVSRCKDTLRETNVPNRFRSTMVVCVCFFVPLANQFRLQLPYPALGGRGGQGAGRVASVFPESKARIPRAEYCGHCHAKEYMEWRESLHASSFRDSFYRRSVSRLVEAKGQEAGLVCDKCHDAQVRIMEHVSLNAGDEKDGDGSHGLTCIACHSVAAYQSVAGDGALLVDEPAVIVNEMGTHVAGEVPYDQILKFPDRHRRAVMQDFYKTSEFCGACHRARPQPESDPRCSAPDSVLPRKRTWDRGHLREGAQPFEICSRRLNLGIIGADVAVEARVHTEDTISAHPHWPVQLTSGSRLPATTTMRTAAMPWRGPRALPSRQRVTS